VEGAPTGRGPDWGSVALGAAPATAPAKAAPRTTRTGWCCLRTVDGVRPVSPSPHFPTPAGARWGGGGVHGCCWGLGACPPIAVYLAGSRWLLLRQQL